MDIRFDKKTIVVIGGSTGIGKECVKQFANSGGKVIFTGIESSEDIDVKDYYNAGDEACVYYRLDNTIEEDVKSFAQYVYDNFGGADVLHNNAGIFAKNILHEIPTKDWERMININLTGMFLTCKYFIPQMLEKGKGAIVNTCSMSGLFADYGFCAYNASKGGVANLTRSLALDYAECGIRTNAVAPGSIRTQMYYDCADSVGGQAALDNGMARVYPTNRCGDPIEVAYAVLFLASEQASFINGVNLLVDGGITAHTGGPRYWDK